MMTDALFTKRIFTFTTLAASLRDLLNHLDDLHSAITRQRVSHAFAEKIMLAVTQVNGCRYCSFAHTRLALHAGLSEVELRPLMAGDFGQVPEHEMVALTFAQQYAEQRGRIDLIAWQRLVDCYGLTMARDILTYIRTITFANLYGNTFDAVLSRCARRPAPDSHLLAEIAILSLPLVMLPAGLVIVFVRHVAALLQTNRSFAAQKTKR